VKKLDTSAHIRLEDGRRGATGTDAMI